MSKFSKLTDSQIKEFISKNYEWDLKDGILICMGEHPDSYDWGNPELGNDFPVRTLADFRTAIRSKKLIPTQICDTAEGHYKLKRDDIIVFFFNYSPADGERTHTIWTAYKKSRHNKVRGYSSLEQEMDEAFKKTLLDEYLRNKKAYDANSQRLKKKTLYGRILKDHPDWNEETLRRSGKKFTLHWAIQTVKHQRL